MQKFLIAGGSGFIGRHLSAYVKELGGEVDLLIRQPDAALSYKQIKWNPHSKEQSISGIIGNYDVVVNLAGASISKRWSAGYKNELVSSRIGSTSFLVDAINTSTSKPKFFINASAVGYYGTLEEGRADESSEPGNDFLANLTEKWEKEASKIDKTVKLIIPRFGVILGKDGGAFPALLGAANRGITFDTGGRYSWKSWIHVDDAVSSILFMLDKGFEGTYNAASPNGVELGSLMATILEQTGKRVRIRMGSTSIKLLLGEGGIHSTIYGQNVVPKVLMEMGYKFKYTDLTEAIRSLL